MKTKLLLLCTTGLLALTACDHLSRDGNAARFYQPYTGGQDKWPVGQGSFVTTYSGMTIYHGLPPVPYTVLGRMDRADIPLFRVVAYAKHHGANAIFLSEQSVEQVQTDHGVMLFGNGFGVQTPSSTRVTHRTEGTAFLIQTNQ